MVCNTHRVIIIIYVFEQQKKEYIQCHNDILSSQKYIFLMMN